MDACTIQFPRRTADAIERLYLDGRPGFDDLIELAVGGDCAASYAVGTALQGAAENRLPPVDRDPLADFSVDTLLERSWAWKEEAAERGNVEAMQELYVAYSEGAAGLERDPNRAEYWLRSGAVAGDVGCVYEFGKRLIELGENEEAAEWLHYAAKHGHIEAHGLLSVLCALERQGFAALIHLLVAKRLDSLSGGTLRNDILTAEKDLVAAMSPEDIAACSAEAEKWRPALN